MRIVSRLILCLLAAPAALVAQLPFSGAVSSPYGFSMPAPGPGFRGAPAGSLLSAFEGAAAAGGGQVEPAAFKDRYLTRLAIRSGVSTLGTGASLATNLPFRIDLRAFGNYTNFNWKINQSGFYIVINIGMANSGILADWYPWKKLRVSPGVLLYNTNRINATLQGNDNATFTLNGVQYISDNNNPITATGGINLGGRGFMATTGWGHIVSRNQKHWNFPFEAGAAFINKPIIGFAFQGEVCQFQGINCAPVNSYPGLTQNLNTQLATWNKLAARFHTYPFIQGGLSYTFLYRH